MVIQFEKQRHGPKSAQRQASEAWARQDGGLEEEVPEEAGVDINNGRPDHAFCLRLMEQLIQHCARQH